MRRAKLEALRKRSETVLERCYSNTRRGATEESKKKQKETRDVDI